MITLTKPTGETVVTPSEHDVLSALAEVLAEPEGEDRFRSVQLRQDDGWMVTAYGCDLVILDHDDACKNPPCHIANLRRADVEAILVRFLQPSDDLSDLSWRSGYCS